MNKISKALHEEYHKAEQRVRKRLGISHITGSTRAIGIVAYLSCVAVKEAKK